MQPIRQHKEVKRSIRRPASSVPEASPVHTPDFLFFLRRASQPPHPPFLPPFLPPFFGLFVDLQAIFAFSFQNLNFLVSLRNAARAVSSSCCIALNMAST